MSHQHCPVYPAPSPSRLVRWWRRLSRRDDLLSQLSPGAYVMQMGETRIAGQGIYLVNDPAAVRQVLVDQAQAFPKHRFMGDLLRPLLGSSIFTNNGEVWHRQRQLMEPAFEHTRLEHAFVPMRDAVQALLERLRQQPPDAVCAIDRETTHVTADIILRTIFSLPLHGGDAGAIFEAFERFQAAAPQATLPRYRPGWWPAGWPRGGAARRADAAAAEIRALLGALIEPRFEAARRGEPGPQQDILASLLAARDAQTGEAMDMTALINEIAVLFLAGHETSASALAWSLDLLARAPQVQQAVHAEARQVFGDGLPEAGQLRHLELTRRVFRETLRIYPPLGFLVREVASPQCIRGKTLAPGSTVILSPWLIHRHRRQWERPDEFDPDRFLGEAGRQSAAQAYLPFSIGPRVCVGAGFALQEAVLVLAMLMREFEVLPVPGHQPMPLARLTLRSDIGIRLALRRR